MDLQEAQKRVEEFLNNKYKRNDDIVMVVIEDMTIEKEYGWYFFPSNKEYLETGDWKKMLVGEGLVLIKKEDGQIIQFRTRYSHEHYIKEFEKEFGYE